MASNIDDITINYEEEGVLVVKELDKEVLSKGGAWVTLVFRYQDWDRKKEGYGPEKFTLRRYRKMNDEYRQQSKFNISNADQAGKLADVLYRWAGKA